MTTKHELKARLDDMQRQLDKLFSFHGISWRQIEKQRRENIAARGAKLPSHPTERFGELHPKLHEQ
jgi:hypothetical protein